MLCEENNFLAAFLLFSHDKPKKHYHHSLRSFDVHFFFFFDAFPSSAAPQAIIFFLTCSLKFSAAGEKFDDFP